MNKRSSGFVLLAAVAAFIPTVWFSDPLLLYIVAYAAIPWIGLPAIFIAGVLLLVALHTGRSRRPALTILSVVVGLGCLIVLAIPLNRIIQQRAVAAAKEYPAQVAPLLEAYRQAHGAYPTHLDELPHKPSVPRLLRRSGRYRADGGTYSFWFPQPGGLIDFWQYDSSTHRWQLIT